MRCPHWPIKIFLLLLLTLDALCEMTFEQFVAKYNKVYANEQQRVRRLNIYSTNVQQIVAHNNNPQATYKQSVTAFADRTDAELVRSKLPTIAKPQSPTVMKIGAPPGPLPKTMSWKDLGKVTPAKDQNKCGACWVFVATGATESYLAIQNGTLYDLSEEYLLECTAFSDCVGGYTSLAFELMINRVIPLQTTYPYTAGLTGAYQQTPGICSSGQGVKLPPNTILNTYYNISNQKLMELVLNGPVAAMYHGTQRAFSFYSTGVYTCGATSVTEDQLDHALVVIGWDSQSNFLVKNSWGDDWGVNGFGVISKDRDCGLKMIVYELYRNGGPGVPTATNNTAPGNNNTTASNSSSNTVSNGGGTGYIIKYGCHLPLLVGCLLLVFLH